MNVEHCYEGHPKIPREFVEILNGKNSWVLWRSTINILKVTKGRGQWMGSHNDVGPFKIVINSYLKS